jgi:Protein of unknown function (DUF2511)
VLRGEARCVRLGPGLEIGRKMPSEKVAKGLRRFPTNPTRLARSLSAIAFLAAILVSCALRAERDPDLSNGEAVVKRAHFGEDWPLTVNGGWLSCQAGGAVVFSARATSYAVNPLARGLPWVYNDISEILADDPENPGQKKDIYPLLRKGLQLCE